MANVGDTLPHCTGTGTQADPYKFDSATGFLEAIDVEGAYVETKNSSMSFDCNDGVITTPIAFKCLDFDGKGLTIVNAVVNNTNSAIMIVTGAGVWAWSESTIQTIANFNIYNCAIVVQNLQMCLVTCGFESGDGYKVVKFLNCNFAGVCYGYPDATSAAHDGTSFIGWCRDNRYMNWTQYRFENCTINFNLSEPSSGHSSNYFNFHAYHSGDFGASFVYLKNTTLCLSGDVSYNIWIGNTVMNNATVMSPKDKSANKLKCNGYSEEVGQNSFLSGANYHKMYVETIGNLTVSDSQGLINSDRYTATGTKSLSGIVMQEHDSTANDYIYDEDNLVAAGFLVGQVIE